MAVSDVTCGLGVKQQHQVLNVREVGLQVFLVHPVVVEVGMTGLGRGERRPEKPVVVRSARSRSARLRCAYLLWRSPWLAQQALRA